VLAAEHQQQPPETAPAHEVVVLIGPGGKACTFDFNEFDDTFTSNVCFDLLDGDGGSDPPRQTVPIEWSVDIWDDAQYGTAAYVQDYVKYGDEVYLFDATPAFMGKWGVKDSPLWAGTTNPPPVSGLKAGYYDPTSGTIYLIGP
jgi:hypothetical protein